MALEINPTDHRFVGRKDTHEQIGVTSPPFVVASYDAPRGEDSWPTVSYNHRTNNLHQGYYETQAGSYQTLASTWGVAFFPKQEGYIREYMVQSQQYYYVASGTITDNNIRYKMYYNNIKTVPYNPDWGNDYACPSLVSDIFKVNPSNSFASAADTWHIDSEWKECESEFASTGEPPNGAWGYLIQMYINQTGGDNNFIVRQVRWLGRYRKIDATDHQVNWD